jgi:hypothetical protein
LRMLVGAFIGHSSAFILGQSSRALTAVRLSLGEEL